MATTFALVVGIDKYDYYGWTLSGPCANACAILDWLLTTDIPKKQIYAFLEPNDAAADFADMQKRIKAYEAAGVQVRRAATWSEIYTFSTAELPDKRPAGSRLFVYWSGHGFTDARDTRIFVCRDYTTKLKSFAFNATHFLRQLRSTDYASFDEHIVLADVCGIRSAGFDVERQPPDTPLDGRRQLTVFATPEGQYAADKDGMGVFTTAVIACVKDLKTWPDPDVLDARLTAALDKVGQTPLLVSKGVSERLDDRRVGTLPAASGNATSQSVLAMLRPLPVGDLVYRRHYRPVIAELELVDRAQGLVGMVEELASLADRYGLLAFLKRLSSEPELATPINDWLKDHAQNDGNRLKTIQDALDREGLRKILFVELPVHPTGALTTMHLELRFRDLRPVPDVRFDAQPVTTYTDFCAKLADAVDMLLTQGHRDFEVHVFTDPALFDRRFHRLRLKTNDCLGDKFVVVLRHRERQYATTAFRRAWERYARELGPVSPKDLRVVKIPGEPGMPLPKERGVCYAHFVLVPPDQESVQGSLSEKQALTRCLRLGIPYLYWSHELPPADADWNTLETDFCTLVRGVAHLGELPDSFTVQRSSGELYTKDATLLWDDPDVVLTFRAQGVERK